MLVEPFVVGRHIVVGLNGCNNRAIVLLLSLISVLSSKLRSMSVRICVSNVIMAVLSTTPFVALLLDIVVSDRGISVLAQEQRKEDEVRPIVGR